MVKKIVALAGAGAILLSMAGPAFGWYLFSKDVAIVGNSATAVANTGSNIQDDIAVAGGFIGNDASAGSSGSRSISTGGASAYAGALVVANTHIGCGLCDGFGGVYHKDFALVGNSASAGAYTGSNWQDDLAEAGGFIGNDASAGSSGSRSISTGGASATGRAWTIVNTHWGM